MTGMKLPKFKLNYDNFYKFVVSLTLTATILGVLATSAMFFLRQYSPMNDFWYGLATAVYLGISSISFYYFIWAIKKWHERQKEQDKKNDEKQDAEIESIQANTSRTMLEGGGKLL